MQSLYKIAYYYKNKYNLHTKIDVVKDYAWTNYQSGIDSIIISLQDIKERYNRDIFKGRIKSKNINHVFIWALLHELKHAIDYNKNSEYFIQLNIAESDLLHNKKQQEIEADIFAKQELKKWI